MALTLGNSIVTRAGPNLVVAKIKPNRRPEGYTLIILTMLMRYNSRYLQMMVTLVVLLVGDVASSRASSTTYN